MRRNRWLLGILGVAVLSAGAQAPKAELRGKVLDGAGHPVSATLLVTGANATQRRTSTAKDGSFRVQGIAPGGYAIAAEAEGYVAETRNVNVSEAQSQEISFTLSIASTQPSMKLSVDSAAEQMSGLKIGGEFEVTKRLIDNLPIDGRNYVQFTLTNSQVKRDSAPAISVLPSSGLSINGQRARFNLVNVDGGSAEDSAGNSIASTVPQEAVQEFNVLTSGFAAEYGQALGGVINVLTRGGSNDFHGSAFGYVRNRNFAAVNPLSNVPNPAYTRVQPGFSLGGPIVKDHTYFFLAFETTRRQETGFSSIGHGSFGLVDIDASNFFGPGAIIRGTPQQAAFLTSPYTPINQQTAAYAALVGAGSSVALNGAQPLFLGGSPTFATSGAPLPASFTPLNAVGGDFPVSESSSIATLRLDHRLTAMQQLMARATFSPSKVKGIQGSGPSGSTFGLTSYARSLQEQYHDFNVQLTHVALFGANKVNEVRFLALRRGISFGSVQNSGLDAGTAGVDLAGYAYIGEDPLHPLDYIEKKFIGTDQFSWTKGSHALKFGGEYTDIPIDVTAGAVSNGSYTFSDTVLMPGLPAFSAVQSYGLGLPLSLLQSIGIAKNKYSNHRLGMFAQDSWKVNSRLKLDYGIRYDAEFNPVFTPSTSMAAAAYQWLGVRESVPTLTRALAPRLGASWDPIGDGKSAVKASFGLFYDHPPTGLDAYSSVFNASSVPLVLLTGGNPCPVAGGTANPFNLSATNAFQGTLSNSNCFGPISGYVPSEQRFNNSDPGAIALFADQGYLNAGVPIMQQPIGQVVSNHYQYPLLEQASLQIEREIGRDYIVSVGYVFNGGHRLFQPIDTNAMNRSALVSNWERAVAAGQADPASSPYAVATCGMGPLGTFVPAPLLSFFRPSGINPSLTGAFAPCMPLAMQVAAEDGLGTGNPPIPVSTMNTLSSSASSVYHGLTASVRRRMGKHYQFQASYTWSHAIDTADDFYVNPQNDACPGCDRSNSALDQRHRFVFSGVYQSGTVGGGHGWNRLLSNWTFAPLIELGSGTPFNILMGTDYASRPSIATSAAQTDLCGDSAVASRYSPTGYLIAPCMVDGVFDGVASSPLFGTLGRNAGTMPWTALTDIRVSQRISFTEKVRLDASADVFNAINHFNVSGVNTLYTLAGTPTAAFEPRVIQIGMKLSW